MNFNFKQLLLLLALVISTPLSSGPPAARSEDEALFARRILEFCRDGELVLAEGQVKAFHRYYPESPLLPWLEASLADEYVKAGKPRQAIKVFERIQDPVVQREALPNHLLSLQAVEDFAGLLDLCEAFGPFEKPELAYFHGLGLWKKAGAMDDSEDRKNTLESADGFLQQAFGSSQDFNARLAQSEVLFLLGLSEEAASASASLEADYPEKKAGLLLREAYFLEQEAPQKALELYEEVLAGPPCPEVSEGAYRWVITAFELRLYERLLEKEENLRELVRREKQMNFDLYLAKALALLEKNEEALKVLDRVLEKAPQGSYEKRAALSLVAASSFSLGNQEGIARASEILEAEFEGSPEHYRAMLFLAIQKRNDGWPGESLQVLKALKEQFGEEGRGGEVLLQESLSLYALKRWQESYDKTNDYLEKFPEGSQRVLAVRYLVLNDLALLETGPSDSLREQLIKDIMRSLNTSGAFEGDQQTLLLLRRAQAMFELKRYRQAIAALDSFIQHFPDHPSLGRAHFLLALCHQASGENLDAFIEHGLEALQLNPHMKEAKALRLNLFNAYLEKEDGKRAAGQLYQVFLQDPASIKKDNQIWLAEFYYQPLRQKIAALNGQAAEDAELIEELKKVEELYVSALTDTHEPQKVQEVVGNLAQVFMCLSKPKESKRVLQVVLEQKKGQSPKEWKGGSRLRLLLGKSQEILGELDEALDHYSWIVQGERSDWHSRHQAALRRARLLYQKLPIEERQRENETFQEVLSLLKDVQIHKTLSWEPIHLEAAIDYAYCAAHDCPSSELNDRLLHHLKRVRVDFTQENSLQQKDYHAARESNPEKDQLYQAYVLFLDARIAELEASLENDEQIARSKRLAAYRLYSSLVSDEIASTEYLIERAEKRLTMLKAEEK